MKPKLIIIFSLCALIIISVIYFQTKKLNNKRSITPISINNKKACPEGYVLVPGSDIFKTNNFCVMKYTAKCTNTNPKCVTGENVYRNNLDDCKCEGIFKVVSEPKGAPITYIPEDDGTNTSAKKYCENSNGHLITNDEWMTIARNVEQVPNNWCDRNGTNCNNEPGLIGKILVNGHNDNNPAKALEASDDNNPCFGTTTDGSNTCGSKSSQKRTLELSNGNIIWDLAGNIWQWIDFKIPRKDEHLSKEPENRFGRWVWEEFQSVEYDPTTMPSNPNWNSEQGVGRIFHYSYLGDSDSTLYTNIRGGNWRHGYDSGAFTSHFQPVPNKTGIDDVGFRCVVNAL